MHTVLSKFGMLECFTSLSWGCRDESVPERLDVFTTGLSFISAHFLLPDPRQKNGKRLNPDAEQEFYCRAVFGPKEPSFILQSFKIAMAIMANPFQLPKTYLFKTGAQFRD